MRKMKIEEKEEELGEEIHEFKHTFVKEQMEKEKELFEDFIVRNGFFFSVSFFFTEHTNENRKPRKEKRRCLKKRSD